MLSVATLTGQNRAPSSLVAIDKAKLCVTSGAIEEKGGALEVNVPEMRAVVTYPTRAVAEARITYLGPTAHDKPLGSGQMRRQFGLKLRAGDPCNLVYVMWRIEPRPDLVVSVKINPGRTTSAECGNRGYTNIRPSKATKPPPLNQGDTHTLRAEIDGDNLHAFIDDHLVWEGQLDSRAGALRGPSGVRSDNGRFRFEFFSSEPVPGENSPCHEEKE